MRQVISVINNGRAQYFMVDEDEASLNEFAAVSVPTSFGAEQAAILGMNLIATLGLTNGHRPPRPQRRAVIQLPAELPLGGGDTDRSPIPDQVAEQAAELQASTLTYRQIAGFIIAAGRPVRATELAERWPESGVRGSGIKRAIDQGLIERIHTGLYVGTSVAPALPRRGRKPHGRAKQQWDVTREQVIDFVRQHPEGVALIEIADALLGDRSARHRQVINNRLIWIMANAPSPVRKETVPAGTRGLTANRNVIVYPNE